MAPAGHWQAVLPVPADLASYLLVQLATALVQLTAGGEPTCHAPGVKCWCGTVVYPAPRPQPPWPGPPPWAAPAAADPGCDPPPGGAPAAPAASPRPQGGSGGAGTGGDGGEQRDADSLADEAVSGGGVGAELAAVAELGAAAVAAPAGRPWTGAFDALAGDEDDEDENEAESVQTASSDWQGRRSTGESSVQATPTDWQMKHSVGESPVQAFSFTWQKKHPCGEPLAQATSLDWQKKHHVRESSVQAASIDWQTKQSYVEYLVQAASIDWQKKPPIGEPPLQASSPDWQKKHHIGESSVRATSTDWQKKHQVGEPSVQAASIDWQQKHTDVESLVQAASPDWQNELPDDEPSAQATPPDRQKKHKFGEPSVQATSTEWQKKHPVVDLLRFHTSKSGIEQISLDQYVDQMREGQSDIYYITCESITAASTSPFLEEFRKKDLEVRYLLSPSDECAVHQLKEFHGRRLKSATTQGPEAEAEDEKKKLEELKITLEPPSLHACRHISTRDGVLPRCRTSCVQMPCMQDQ